MFGATEYSTAVDIWSIGCIFGELILREPLLPGRGEIDQVNKVCLFFFLFAFLLASIGRKEGRRRGLADSRKEGPENRFNSQIFKLLGRPTEEMWPGFRKLPNAKSFNVEAAQP